MPEEATKWRNRPQSMNANANAKPRTVDRELQRIKSLAVVSGLNRAFSSSTSDYQLQSSLSPPTPSPSTSTTVSATPRASEIRRRSSTVQSKRMSISSFPSEESMKSMKSMKSSVSSNSIVGVVNTTRKRSSTVVQQPPKRKNNNSSKLDELEKELWEMFQDAYTQKNNHQRVDEWVDSTLPGISQQPSSSSQEWEQEQHLLQQKVALYLAEKEKEAVKSRQLAEIVVKQEQLIDAMQHQLVAAVASNERWLKEQDWGDKLDAARGELAAARAEIASLTETKQGLEQMLVSLWSELELGQALVRRQLQTIQEIQSQCQDQRVQIDEKLHVLKTQLLEKETLLQKYRNERQQVQVVSVPVAVVASPPAPDRPARSTRRNSAHSTASKRRSGIARWTGVPLPPQAPPPTEPLPPLPNEPATSSSSSSAPSSTPSPTPTNTNEQQPQPQPQQPVVESALTTSPSLPDSTTTLIEDIETDAAYREFTEQLQARLSISKDMIDGLRLWEPADFEELQRRIDTRWSLDDPHSKRHSIATSSSSREGTSAAFWRGMKKKLRV